MNKLSPAMIRALIIGLVVVIVGGGAWYLLSGDSTKKVTAEFSSAVGVYPGTPVKILGIDVGEVTSAHPEGSYVKVKMTYDSKYKLPDAVTAVIVANSLVSDRYIQLGPSYKGTGPTFKNGGTIPLKRTASPAELDDIYASLSKLTTALGPNGANKNGALSEFINVAEANLQGNGAAFGESITNLSKAAETLSNSSGDLFGTVKNLQAFTAALNQSDAQIRNVENELAQVATDLASERADLGTALHNLAGALDQVSSFVKTNAAKTHTDLVGLAKVAELLVKEQTSLNETLAVGPVALANIVHAYQPDLGVIASRGNLGSLTDVGNLCDALNIRFFSGGLGVDGLDIGGLLSSLGIGNILGSLTQDIASACNKVIVDKGGTKLPAGMTMAQAKAQLEKSLVDNSDAQLGGLLPGN